MDLTYMPGELDYKDIKKDDSKIKRDHSVDDFEHVDPDSPAEIKPNTVSPFNTDKIISEIQPEQISSLNDHIPHPYTTHGDSNLHVGLEDSSSKQLDPFGKLLISDPAPIIDNTTATDDFDLNVAQSDLFNSETTLSANTKKDQNIDSSESIKSVNSSFIEAEVIKNKDDIENENASFKFEEKSKKNDKNTSSESFPSVMIDANKEISSGSLVDDSISIKEVSMKEADALSQYDVKAGKKDSDPLAGVNFIEQNHDIPSKIDSDNLDPFAPEPTKLQSHPDTSQSKVPKADLSSSVFEPEYDTDTHHVCTDKNNAEEPKDGPYIEYSIDKPYIAICPSKPETEETPHIASHEKKASVSDLDDIIGPEDVFKRIGLDAWFTPDRLHPKVEALVYWRDPKKSGVVFGGVMAILLSLCYMSLISVVAYSSLLALSATIAFRIYKNILQAVQKTSEGHPFKEFLDLELTLPQEKMREIVDTAVVHVNASIGELRRLFLVEDLIDSIKFGVCLWCLTYVGAIFNGMTLVILAFVALFTVPKIYENNKASIDQYIEMGRSKVAEITTKVKAAVPIGKKEEKDKEQ